MHMHLFFLLNFLLLCCIQTSLSAAPYNPSMGMATDHSSSTIHWYTSYDEALQESKDTQKPLILFFTGSDWCHYCKKLDRDALNTPEFAAIAGPKFVFLKLDQPQDSSKLDPKVSAKNKALRQKYDVRTYPTLIILDPSGQKIGKTEYRDYKGRQYAEHLLNIVRQATNYRQNLSSLDQQQLSAEDYEKLYQQAKELHFADDSALIAKKALVAAPNCLYFLKEEYRSLAVAGKMKSPEAHQLKQKILALDPTNEKRTHLDIAVIEFETLSGQAESCHLSAETATAPLVAYLAKFGNQDTESAWRLQMMISQVFLDNDQLHSALRHAQSSYQLAPPSVRPGIALTIQNIQSSSSS